MEEVVSSNLTRSTRIPKSLRNFTLKLLPHNSQEKPSFWILVMALRAVSENAKILGLKAADWDGRTHQTITDHDGNERHARVAHAVASGDWRGLRRRTPPKRYSIDMSEAT